MCPTLPSDRQHFDVGERNSEQTASPLRGKVVAITGGNAGIGLALARGVAQAGADVAVLARRPEANERACAELESFGVSAASWQCDVALEDDVVNAFQAVAERFGRLDSVFANAGIFARARLIDTSLAEWRRVQSINLDGVFLTLREGARHMVAFGNGGALVAVGSTSMTFGAPRSPSYAAAKAGLVGLVRSAAIDLAADRIRVNALVPGWSDTDMLDMGKQNERFVNATIARTPAGRWGTAGDFAAPAVFLADPTLIFHTGDAVVVDGGYSVF
ncbi:MULTISPECIES: SDR family NAD(P)-dependent oxidoreductase [Mycobacterium]|uniref:SDR family NAD(P)-dependent oxidoreductase n=1 Tax=Mycobacterium TaxID=1763 RepID=UPI0009F4ADF7|nr:SDR family oxidoreductase [Mycobacterium paraseoulense]MCV7393831.1 SDR family oxidoreductase [Mycobacterium paraseoulense]BBZ70548.1 2-deoxy-D-gluconate 3-dehydrogenase [Mycobacterium paraseoulense]